MQNFNTGVNKVWNVCILTKVEADLIAHAVAIASYLKIIHPLII